MEPSPSSKKSFMSSSLTSSQTKALKDFKAKLISSNSPTTSIWGVNLTSTSDVRADVILLKFLTARDFNVSNALTMLLTSLQWRRDSNVDAILSEDLGFKDLEGVVAYMRGFDRLSRPVCYNAYGVFKDREMYERVFGDEEKIKRFLRWRVQILEKGIGLLDFKPGGVDCMIQVTDLKDMPKRELRVASNQILSLFQDNYPEMVARKSGCGCAVPSKRERGVAQGGGASKRAKLKAA